MPASAAGAASPPAARTRMTVLLPIRFLFKSTLIWSGRYATPRDAAAWKKENKEFDALEDPPVDPDRPVIRTPITTFVWSEFNRLYQIAYAELERP